MRPTGTRRARSAVPGRAADAKIAARISAPVRPQPDTADAIRSIAAGQLGRWSPIIVSNRAPYEPAGALRFRRGSGGLVTALLSVAEATGASWIGCARTNAERSLARQSESVTAASAGRPPLQIHYVDPGEGGY